jgi:hypothetical protein
MIHLLFFYLQFPAIILFIGATPTSARDVLDTATELANGKLKGYRYGDTLAKHEINCVQFLSVVIENLLGRKLTPDERDAVCINERFENLAEAVARGDDRTKGVVFALTTVIKSGRPISASHAEPGDFIQYWIRSVDGSWHGHAAIISRVWIDVNGRSRAEIFGAHKSLNRIDYNSFSNGEGLALEGQDRKVYLARFITTSHGRPASHPTPRGPMRQRASMGRRSLRSRSSVTTGCAPPSLSVIASLSCRRFVSRRLNQIICWANSSRPSFQINRDGRCPEVTHQSCKL